MPTMPDKFALGQAPGGGTSGPALIPDLSAAAGDGTIEAGAVARGLGEIGATLQAKQDEADHLDVQKKLINFDLDQQKRLDDAKHSYAPGAEGFTQDYRQDYDASARDFMASSVPERLKPKIDEILVKRRAHWEGQANHFENLERDRFAVQGVKDAASDLITDTMGNPDRMADNHARLAALYNRSQMSTRARFDGLRQAIDMNYRYGIKSMIEAARLPDGSPDYGRILDLQKRLKSLPKSEMLADVGASPGSGTDDDSLVPGDLREAVKKFEGYTDKAEWDYKQHSIGYGTKALSPDEVIDKATAEDRLNTELTKAAQSVDKFAPNVDSGTRKALISLTYNSGEGWMGSGLGKAVQDGDTNVIKQRFLQYNKAGGRTNAGLASRRRTEAKWIGTGSDKAQDAAQDAAEGTATLSPDQVERSGLPDVGAPGKADSTGPATATLAREDAAQDAAQDAEIDENGNPIPKRPGVEDTKSDMGSPPEPGPFGGDLIESPTNHFPGLTPKTRQTLIREVGLSLRATATQQIEDDIANLKRGIEPKRGADGLTNLDRVKAIPGMMTPMQVAHIEQRVKAAQFQFEALSPLREMSSDQATSYVSGLFDRAEQQGVPLKDADAIQKKAYTALDKREKLLASDPMQFLRGKGPDVDDPLRQPTPAMAQAYEIIRDSRTGGVAIGADGRPMAASSQIPDAAVSQIAQSNNAFADLRKGGPVKGAPAWQATTPEQEGPPQIIGAVTKKSVLTPQQQYDVLFRAAIDDQRRLNPDKSEKEFRIISAADATKILGLPKDVSTISLSELRSRLRTARDDIVQKVGPDWAKKVMTDALELHLRGEKNAQQRKTVLRDLADDKPVDLAEMARSKALDALDSGSLASRIDSMGRADSMGRPDARPGAPLAEADRPAIAQDAPAPSARQAEWLKANPDGWQAFDQRFGSGSAAKILGGSTGDPWGKARGDVSKRTWRDDEKGLKPKTGYWPFN